VLGFADKLTVGGADTGDTVTVVLAEAEPPLPVQVIVYVVVTEGDTDADPEIPLAVNPLPTQDVALVDG
jgi:acetaldehyde dehydrogenase (acetylating)